MLAALPATAPQTLGAAFKHIYAIDTATVDDLKVMVLVEAAGLTLYAHSAGGTDHPGVKDLLNANGREEMVHAGRVSKAIKALTGETYPPPTAANNPYLQSDMPPADPLTADGLRKLADTEFGGDALYSRWAKGFDNAEAVELLLQNGREESDHGNRLLEAAALLDT